MSCQLLTKGESAIFGLDLHEEKSCANENGLFFMETSAKKAYNVNEVFYEIDMLQKTSQSLTELSFEIGIHSEQTLCTLQEKYEKVSGLF